MSRVISITGVPIRFPNSGHNGPPVEPSYSSDYISIWEFEKYDHTPYHDWMYRNWHVSLYASGIYVALIFIGQFLMRNRLPFGLRKTLLGWNVCLAAFSMLGFWRSFHELWYEWTVSQVGGGGLLRSICFADNHNVATSLWGLLFAWSKMVEFGDTAFIVLRKQRLIFLHWYHHVTVLIYCWFAYAAYDPSSRWFCTMNYLVHAFMYTYYATKVLHWRLPKWFPMFITIIQIMQMVVGVCINVYTFYIIKIADKECRRPISNVYMAFGMYASYFILFFQFFVRAYIKKKPKSN